MYSMCLADEQLFSFNGRAHRFSAVGERAAFPVALIAAALAAIPALASEDRDLPVWYSQIGRRPAAPPKLVGDGACAACHQDKVATYHQTAHFKTSSWPSAKTIHGRFGAGSDTMGTANPDLRFVMESNERGFFQTARVVTDQGSILSRTERMDVVVGSGRKGQTYLFWKGELLFELPVSYWTELDSWVNSPGYVDGDADFGRPIVPRCMECHGSSFVQAPPPENRYDKGSFVLGIICEKCHGPGSEHAARFRSGSPPKTYSESAIINPAKLSRARQLDVCGLCHEGAGKPLVPSLSFIPGAELAKYLEFPRLAPDARIDVHASQVQMLERSRCFRQNKTLTCFTCHDVHIPQRNTDAFSSRCLTCHEVENCRAFPKLGHVISNKCVDCHMPLQETGKIIAQVGGVGIQPKVRNHLIAIYNPDVALP
jgi:hypothetical protein